MSNISEHELQEAHDKLRDQFAMAALTGLLARKISLSGRKEATNLSYKLADAMMEARKQ